MTPNASSQWILVSEGRVLEVVTCWATLREFRKLGCEPVESLEPLAKDLTEALPLPGKKVELLMSDGEELDYFLQPVMGTQATNRLTLDNSKKVVLVLLDKSPHLFEVHPEDWFIGVNKAVTEIKEPKYREALLMLGIYYGLRMLSGETREDVLMAECKQIGTGLFGSEEEYNNMWRAVQPMIKH